MLFLTGKLTWTKFHQLLFIYLLICILFFGMSNNRLVISSSQLEKLNTKLEESMDDCHPHLQNFSTSTTWSYIEENFKTACKIVGNCHKLLASIKFDLESFSLSKFNSTHVEKDEELICAIHRALERFYIVLGQCNSSDFLGRIHKEFIAALAGPGENKLTLRYNLLPAELNDLIEIEFPEFAEFCNSMSEPASPVKTSVAFHSARSPRDHSRKAAIQARMMSPSKKIPSSAASSPSPVKRRTSKNYIVPQDDDTDTDEETPEVSFSPGKSSKTSDTKVNSGKSVCTTTPKVQFISDLIVSSNIEKQDSLKLYDDLVMELQPALSSKWTPKFEPFQKVVEFYSHPQQVSLFNSCAKLNKHSMPVTGEPAVSELNF